jgi:Zn finger protein HypA/HybF involved in hydrogenase expression
MKMEDIDAEELICGDCDEPLTILKDHTEQKTIDTTLKMLHTLTGVPNEEINYRILDVECPKCKKTTFKVITDV